MNHQGTKTIRTDRLILRALEPEDAKTLFENGCLGSTPEEAGQIVGGMMQYAQDQDNYHWGLEYKGQVVGRVKITEISPRDSYMQLAYDIGPSYRNLGLMTEAVRGVIDFLFREVGAHRIYGQCRAYNIASARVMQKAGMMHEGRQRKHYAESDGTYSDVDIYGILREDFFTAV